ncbi:MAG: DUF3108 domain-containing protein [Pseudomonadota bacterium]
MISARFRSAARGLLFAATFAASALAVPAQALEPVAADYEAHYMGLSAKGRMTLEPQGGNQWKYTLKVSNQLGQLIQTTVFEERDGQWRPLTGTDASLLLIKKIRRNAVYDWAGGVARWTGDVKPERAGPIPLQSGDVDGLVMNLALVRDAIAGKPLRYRLVDEGRAKPMQFSVAGRETISIAGKPQQATKLVSTNGNKQMLVWVVEGLTLPARILQRKDGKDDIDLRIVSLR